jgi:hypothetical protein
MTQEEKELLLKDLCARLPYYPKCEMIDELRVVNNEKDSSYISTLFPRHIELFSYHNNFTIKPYLRPMSSMTEEEKEELFNLSTMGNAGVNTCWESFGVEIISTHPRYGDHYSTDYKVIDWLNKSMFDYRGLIEKGLAIEVTEENNPYKE